MENMARYVSKLQQWKWSLKASLIKPNRHSNLCFNGLSLRSSDKAEFFRRYSHMFRILASKYSMIKKV